MDLARRVFRNFICDNANKDALKILLGCFVVLLVSLLLHWFIDNDVVQLVTNIFLVAFLGLIVALIILLTIGLYGSLKEVRNGPSESVSCSVRYKHMKENPEQLQFVLLKDAPDNEENSMSLEEYPEGLYHEWNTDNEANLASRNAPSGCVTSSIECKRLEENPKEAPDSEENSISTLEYPEGIYRELNTDNEANSTSRNAPSVCVTSSIGYKRLEENPKEQTSSILPEDTPDNEGNSVSNPEGLFSLLNNEASSAS